MSQLADADQLIRAHIVDLPRPALVEQGKQPMGQVLLVQVGPQRRTVAGDHDGLAAQGVADEISNGKVGVQGQVAPHEGKAAGDDHLDAIGILVEGAQVFGRALAETVGIGRMTRVRANGPRLVQGGDLRRLGPIDPARADQKKALGPDLDPEIEQVPGPRNDLPEALQGRKPWA